MIPASEVEAMRGVVEDTFVDEGTITRPAPRPAYDKGSGTTSVAPPETIYAGSCRLAAASTIGDRRSEVAGEPVQQRTYWLRIPYDAHEVQVEDRFELTRSASTPLLGRSMRVADVIHGGSVPLGRRLVLTDDLG